MQMPETNHEASREANGIYVWRRASEAKGGRMESKTEKQGQDSSYEMGARARVPDVGGWMARVVQVQQGQGGQAVRKQFTVPYLT